MQDSSPTPKTNIDDWQKLPQFVDEHPQYTMQQMRWLMLHRHENGLDEHTRKIGKPIYIHVPGFLSWIENYSKR